MLLSFILTVLSLIFSESTGPIFTKLSHMLFI